MLCHGFLVICLYLRVSTWHTLLQCANNVIHTVRRNKVENSFKLDLTKNQTFDHTGKWGLWRTLIFLFPMMLTEETWIWDWCAIANHEQPGLSAGHIMLIIIGYRLYWLFVFREQIAIDCNLWFTRKFVYIVILIHILIALLLLLLKRLFWKVGWASMVQIYFYYSACGHIYTYIWMYTFII